MPCGQPCGVFGQFGQLRLTRREDRPRFTRGFDHLGKPLVMAVIGPLQLVDLPPQPPNHFAGVTVQGPFPLHIALQLPGAAFQRLDQGQRPRLLIGQRVPLQRQALQDRAGDHLFLAPWRQQRLGRLARCCQTTRSSFGLRLGNQPVAQCGFSHRARHVGLAPAPPQKHPFGLPHLLGQLTVAGGLLGLPGQHRQLLRQAFQHIVDPQKVRLGPGELQFGLMPAGVKTADPGGFLQDPAAGLGLGADQFGDLPLPHQRG